MGHDYYMVCLSCKVRTASLGKMSELQANISEWPKIFSFLEAHQGHPISFLHDEDIRDWEGVVMDSDSPILYTNRTTRMTDLSRMGKNCMSSGG